MSKCYFRKRDSSNDPRLSKSINAFRPHQAHQNITLILVHLENKIIKSVRRYYIIMPAERNSA